MSSKSFKSRCVDGRITVSLTGEEHTKFNTEIWFDDEFGKSYYCLPVHAPFTDLSLNNSGRCGESWTRILDMFTTASFISMGRQRSSQEQRKDIAIRKIALASLLHWRLYCIGVSIALAFLYYATSWSSVVSLCHHRIARPWYHAGILLKNADLQ